MCQHGSQIELRIESVELGRTDQGVYSCGTFGDIVFPSSFLWRTLASVRASACEKRGILSYSSSTRSERLEAIIGAC